MSRQFYQGLSAFLMTGFAISAFINAPAWVKCAVIALICWRLLVDLDK